MTGHPGFEDLEYRKRRDFIAKRVSDHCDNILYTETENRTWQHVYEKLDVLYPEKSCSAHRSSLSFAGLSKKTIPQFSDINLSLKAHGFKVSPVEGLIDTREFMESLADGTMMCTRYIRHHSKPEYTPEPDIIHEVLGHCVFFHNQKYRELNISFGKAARKAADDLLEKIARIYWYTVEFGICTELNKPVAWGAGLLSSIEELSRIDSIETGILDLDLIIGVEYDTTKPHEKLYKSDSTFEETADHIIKFLSNL